MDGVRRASCVALALALPWVAPQIFHARPGLGEGWLVSFTREWNVLKFLLAQKNQNPDSGAAQPRNQG